MQKSGRPFSMDVAIIWDFLQCATARTQNILLHLFLLNAKTDLVTQFISFQHVERYRSQDNKGNQGGSILAASIQSQTGNGKE